MTAETIKFDNVIGQERAKRQLAFLLSSHIRSRGAFPNLLMTGSKGDGKTHLAREVAKQLPDFNDGSRNHKRFFPINGASVKNPTMFFEDICPAFADGDTYATIFIDEAHMLPKALQRGTMLSVLEPNKRRVNTVMHDDMPYTFDFHKVTFILATTEIDQLFDPLKDRLEEIALEPYNASELAQIMEMVIEGGVEFEEGVLEKLATHVRRNARKADNIANHVLSMGHPVFKQEHFEELRRDMNLFELGVSIEELAALKCLDVAGSEGLKLGALASELGKSSKVVQKGLEPYLLGNRLMSIDGNRRITPKGREYLTRLKKDQ